MADWFWCLDHERVEKSDSDCPRDRLMGPYASEEEARQWRDKVDARNEDWDAADREWEGESEG